jgi:hypothetical protein
VRLLQEIHSPTGLRLALRHPAMGLPGLLKRVCPRINLISGGGHNSDASYGRGWKEKGDRSAWREERGEEKSYVLNDVAIHQWAISDQDEGATFITCSHPQDGKHRIASRKADR